MYLQIKKSLLSFFQKPHARTSSLTSLDLFAVQLLRSFPLNGTSFGSISVSFYTSDNIFIARFLKSLCMIVTKPPFLQLTLFCTSNLFFKSLCLIVTKPPFWQLILCCISNLLPHGHIFGNFEIFHLYLKLIESQKCCLDNSKPYSVMGNMASQLDAPFSALSCKSRFDFSDVLSLRCCMTFLYAFYFSF